MKRYSIASTAEIDKRHTEMWEFFEILDSQEQPFIVTDLATVYDIYVGDEYELIKKIYQKYGVMINLKFFNQPFWQLLDYLKANRTK